MDTTLTITDNGRIVLNRMASVTMRVGDVYGQGSKEHVMMLQSLLAVHQNLNRLGGRTVAYPDSAPLSLELSSFIYCGIIFRPTGTIRCPACYAAFPKGTPVGLDPVPDCTRCEGRGEVLPTTEDMLAEVAIPGEWTTHS